MESASRATSLRTEFEHLQERNKNLEEEYHKLNKDLLEAKRIERGHRRKLEELENDVEISNERAKKHKEEVEGLEEVVKKLKEDQVNLNERLIEAERHAQQDSERQEERIDELNAQLEASLAEYTELREFIIETFDLDETTTTITTELLTSLRERHKGGSKDEIKRLHAPVDRLRIDLAAAQTNPAPDNQQMIKKLTDGSSSSSRNTRRRDAHTRPCPPKPAYSTIESHKGQRFAVSETSFTRTTHSSYSSYSNITQISGSFYEQSDEY